MPIPPFRALFVVLHRYVGLLIAGFLFVAGLTGSVISWHHELDEWLNPNFYRTVPGGPTLAPLDLAARVESADPRAWVTYIPTSVTPGEGFDVFVDARPNPATGAPFDLDYNQVFLDPASGEILGRRKWGEAGLDRAHLIPFLFTLHYSLCIPEFWGVNKSGAWLMGGVALLWIVDSFVGFALTLPPKRRGAPRARLAWWSDWKLSWRIKWPSAAYRLNVDVHRAFGLLLWTLLLVLSVSAACLNLDQEIARPIVGLFSSVTPTPLERREPLPPSQAIQPRVGFSEIIERAKAKAVSLGWRAPLGAVGYMQSVGVYRADFFAPGEEDGPSGAGPSMLYFDNEDGRLLGERIPLEGTGGDLFLALQLPLHSGRIIGTPGRIAISAMGVIVAILSATGVVIWWKKRRARVIASTRNVQTGILSRVM